MYALAAQGQGGVERVRALMEKDFRTNIVLTSMKSLRHAGADLLALSATRLARHQFLNQPTAPASTVRR